MAKVSVLGPARWLTDADALWWRGVVNIREARLNGRHVGEVHGVDAPEGNPSRPRAWLLILDGSDYKPERYSFIDQVRTRLLEMETS